MGKYAVKQPNGLYCYYSDSLHQIWAYNMTFEQLVEYNARTWDKTLEEASRDMRWCLENPLYSFDELLEDWVWYDEEIHELMNAKDSTVKPCFNVRQGRII